MDKRNSIKKLCTVCGAEFSVPKCRKNAKFCSRNCHSKGREKSKTITKQCKFCGKDFTTFISVDNDFCSQNCYQLSRRNRITKICITCGKEFEVKKSQDHVQSCSPECGYLFIRSKTTNLSKSSDWEDLRKIIIKRDGNTCMVCGDNKNLSVHHKVPISEGGNNDRKNLITVCRMCHAKIHGNSDSLNFFKEVKVE